MPKLLIINVTCNQGSTGKISEQVGLMMKERGWDVYYAHGARRVNQSQLKTIPFSSIHTEYFHALKSLLFDADGLGSTKATKFLVEQIKQIKPDVIQLHNIHGYYLNIKVLFEYLNKTDIPIVMTLHDCWTFTGHCTHFVTADCNKWKQGCYDCPLKFYEPKKAIIDKSRRNYQLKKTLIADNPNVHIVTVSDWMYNLVKQSMYYEHNIHIIKNGIDLNTFRPSLCHSNNDNFYVLGVSNVWNKDKGFYDILKLKDLLPDDIKITLVGLSQNQIKKLPSGIQGITGTSNQQELADIYSSHDVLINPTYADTYPTVNLESIACGTPVITYNTGGSPESICDATGITIPKGDIAQLAHEIIKMKVSYNKYKTYKVCREFAEQNFDSKSCFQQYISLYGNLITDK